MKAFVLAGFAAVAFATSAMAQYGDAVEPRINRRGDVVCPSNYVVRGSACVSIYAGRRGYEDRRGGYEDRRGGYDGRRRGFDDDGYRRGRERRAEGFEPRINRRGERECPSNFVIRRGLCVSLY